MKNRLRIFICREKGDAVTDVLLFAFILVFAIFPVASVILEKYIAMAKGQQIQDALDITNVAVYNAMSLQAASMASVDFNSAEAMDIYRELLAMNMKLDSDLAPLPGSVAESTVVIEELHLYTGGFPINCSKGKLLNRPTIHTCVSVPVRPSLYRAILLQLMGKEYVELKVHVDTELPVNR